MSRLSLNHLKKYNRIHMSKEPIEELVFEDNINNVYRYKPEGLYYSLGTEWIEWVQEEMPEWEYDYLYSLEINKNNILVIDSFEALTKFTKEYKDPTIDNDLRNIRWDKVSENYSGIEFTNYRKIKYSIYYTPLWFSCVDVSSGCIWDKKAIKSFQKINEKR